MVVSGGLDLGTTRIKTGVLEDDGALYHLKSAAAPPIKASGLVFESDPVAYLEAATKLLGELIASLPKDTPIGLAFQRSTFLIWDKNTGDPVTSLISWQDRRANAWCLSHGDAAKDLIKQTGLLLSPHYAGPKLAHLFSEDKSLHQGITSGKYLFGTIDTYLIWKWTSGRIYQTDLSMAARTLLVNIHRGEYSDALLGLFGLPRDALPEIAPSFGKKIHLDAGGIITSTIADQASGVLSVMQEASDISLVNLGTGGFVVCPTGKNIKIISGYLTGPIQKGPQEEAEFACEGTINGIGSVLEGLEECRPELSQDDSFPDVFCLPDTSGLGAPFWMADMPFLSSGALGRLKDIDRKRILMEGIIFRVCQILNDLAGQKRPANIFLAGGLAEEEFIYQGLALCLGRPIQRLNEKETTLLGAARLASGRRSWPFPESKKEIPRYKDHYLEKKFHQWKKWVESVLK